MSRGGNLGFCKRRVLFRGRRTREIVQLLCLHRTQGAPELLRKRQSRTWRPGNRRPGPGFTARISIPGPGFAARIPGRECVGCRVRDCTRLCVVCVCFLGCLRARRGCFELRCLRRGPVRCVDYLDSARCRGEVIGSWIGRGGAADNVASYLQRTAWERRYTRFGVVLFLCVCMYVCARV